MVVTLFGGSICWEGGEGDLSTEVMHDVENFQVKEDPNCYFIG